MSEGIEIRLTKNFSNVNIFNKAAKPYDVALKENGHKQKLKVLEKRKAPRKSQSTEDAKTPDNEKRGERKGIKKIKKTSSG